MDTAKSKISSACERNSASLSPAIGCGVKMTGYPGAPHIAAMDLDVSMNRSVHIVTAGTPAFSTWTPSCTLHALHDPQSPTPTIT